MEVFKAAKEALAMRDKVSAMDKRLKDHVISVEHNGIKVWVNGKNEFRSFRIPDDLLKERKEIIESHILDAFNAASDKAQAFMAEESKKLVEIIKTPSH